MSTVRTISKFFLTCALLLSLAGATAGCKRNGNEGSAQQPPAELPTTPALRLVLLSTVAGALEPCGCVKDMLGGVDHAAALVQAAQAEAPEQLVLAAGPLFFLGPELSDDKRTQDVWKAESLAEAMADIGLAAWAPGANDFALDVDGLARLAKTGQARVLAANLKAKGLPASDTFVRDVGGLKVGVAGVSVPEHRGSLPEGVQASDPKAALAAAKRQLDAAGAQVRIALLAMQRGRALRLAESVPGFQIVLVGKAADEGEANDAPTPPVLVGSTLVVQAPNHLQAVALVDLFVRDGSLHFADGSSIEVREQRASLERRIAEFERRLQVWKRAGTVSPEDLRAREQDLARMRKQLAQLSEPRPPRKGSFFRYDLREVRESLGTDAQVSKRLSSYYKRVNEHNREAFKNKKPAPAPPGSASFVGAEACKECHEAAYTFWKNTGHAGAYETLEVDHKQFNLDCVGCHVTGYEQPGGSTVTFVENLKDVQCEECHAAGSLHVQSEDVDDILLTPPKSLCKKCHHPPHVTEDWSVDEAWTHIIGEGHGG